MKAKHKLTKADWDWLNGRQAAAARPEAEKPGTDTGTPETRRKLTSDHLRKLLEADKLTQDQYDAALEIGEALHRITAPVSLRISNPAREVFSRGDDGESVRAARIVNRYAVGADGKHLKLTLSDDGVNQIEAIAFRLGELAESLPEYVDVAYQLEVDQWNGNRRLQCNVQDIRPAAGSVS